MRFLYLILALLSIIAFVRGGKPCELPKNKGPGKGSFPRFYYCQKEQKCKPFNYGGKGGNNNNFKTLKACNKKCVCGLPVKTGNGFAIDERWYYDEEENACKTFNFGGGNGNANNFMSAWNCLSTCGTPENGTIGENPSKGGNPSKKESKVCKLPMNKGRGKGSYSRFYYNQKEQKCKPFNYRGKGGNDNNFETFKACNNECVCDQPMKAGNGLAINDRFYYNRLIGGCVLFNFGGGEGNANNFRSAEDCLKACGKLPEEYVCELPKDKGPGKALLTRYYYNQEKQRCTKFSYGGKGGNGNNFKTLKACKDECVCGQPLNTGNGFAIDERWHYDRMSKGCVLFNFEGGNGNANNFKSAKDCLKACGTEVKKPPIGVTPIIGGKPPKGGQIYTEVGVFACTLPMEVGEGKARHQRWYFNGKVCKKFNFKGGNGNANNFKSAKDCLKACGTEVEKPSTGSPIPFPGGEPHTEEGDACTLPMEVGIGKARHQRWYFNGKMCTKFNFKGGNGNPNNFESEEDCRKACVNRNSNGGKPSATRKPSKGKKPSNKGKNVCQQEMDVGKGSGKGKKQRFYYHQNNKRCMKFNYHGKGGNGNNFKNLKACNMKCVCGQHMEKGSGSRKQTRWYYNKERNECKQFKYRGKFGNANNFKNRKACSKACLKKKEG